jgi:MYXO-CTERM domain-containing protein
MSTFKRSRKLGLALAIAAGAGVLAAPAQAAVTLIGDTLRFERQYPSVGTDFEPDQFTTVVAGVGDQVFWGPSLNQAAYAVFNPEANSITYQALRLGIYVPLTSGQFDGYRISEFDHDIVAVSLVNNTSYDMRVSFDKRSILVNLGGTGLANETFRLDIRFADPVTPPNGVPEPGVLALASLGLLGLRRQRRAATRG